MEPQKWGNKSMYSVIPLSTLEPIRAGNVFLVSEKRTVNGVESLPRIGVLYGTAGAWKTSAVRMGDTREYA